MVNQLDDISGRVQVVEFTVTESKGFKSVDLNFKIIAAPYGVNWDVVKTGDGDYINWTLGGNFRRYHVYSDVNLNVVTGASNNPYPYEYV